MSKVNCDPAVGAFGFGVGSLNFGGLESFGCFGFGGTTFVAKGVEGFVGATKNGFFFTWPVGT